MISRCSEIIVNWLERKEAVNHENYELYYYVSYSLIITTLPVCLALIVGGIMRMSINTLLVILPFVIIRKYSVGYHSKRLDGCFFDYYPLYSYMGVKSYRMK